MLTLESVRANYGRIPILNGISMSVGAGEYVGVLGHNGMGKTTLLKTVIGLLPALGGTVSFNGTDVTALPTAQRALRGMGYVPQGRQIFPALSVLDNLRIGCVMRASDGDDPIAKILEIFPRLQRLLDRAGGTLSGGEQQLLAVARCLAGNPAIILLDEPTEGIQPSIRDEIIETLLAIKQSRGMAMLLVEQNLDFISALSERVLILQKGQILREVKPADLADATLVDEFVGMH